MATIAEQLVGALNQYEYEHAHDAQANVWEDVIWAQAGEHIDEEASRAEEGWPGGKVAVFDDESAVRWLEDEHRWVFEVPE